MQCYGFQRGRGMEGISVGTSGNGAGERRVSRNINNIGELARPSW